jgi:hypothetical protein
MDFSESSRELAQYLGTGEKLLWSGKPRRGFILRGCDMLLIPFSLISGGGSLFGALISFHSPQIEFKLNGIVCVLLGFYLLIGRFFYDAARRKNTVYGLTKDRILIKSGLFSPGVNSIPIVGLKEMELIDQGNGKGNIVLDNDLENSDVFRSMALPGSSKRIAPALESLSDAQKVYELIRNLQKTQA